MAAHDASQQASDQYRSLLLCHTDAQAQAARQLSASTKTQVLLSPVEADVGAPAAFYAAEAHHQGYYERHASSSSYCSSVTTLISRLQESSTIGHLFQTDDADGQ